MNLNQFTQILEQKRMKRQVTINQYSLNNPIRISILAHRITAKVFLLTKPINTNQSKKKLIIRDYKEDKTKATIPNLLNKSKIQISLIKICNKDYLILKEDKINNTITSNLIISLKITLIKNFQKEIKILLLLFKLNPEEQILHQTIILIIISKVFNRMCNMIRIWEDCKKIMIFGICSQVIIQEL